MHMQDNLHFIDIYHMASCSPLDSLWNQNIFGERILNKFIVKSQHFLWKEFNLKYFLS
jgi:hypothetical protein